MVDEYKIKPFNSSKSECIYKSHDSKIKRLHIFIKDDQLLKKYNDIWNKVSNSIKKVFDSETIYDKKFLKAKIKSYGDEVISIKL